MADSTEHAGERTEMPTPLRLAEARRQGHVARSAELVAAAVSLAGLAALAVLGRGAFEALRQMTALMLGRAGADGAAWSTEAARAAWPVLVRFVALLVAVVLAAVAANVAQFGLLLSGEPVKVDLARVSPAAGLARMFSLRSAVRVAMSAAKLAIVAIVVWVMVRGAMLASESPATASAEELARLAGGKLLAGGLWAAAGISALAVVDLIYQRWQYRQDLKMTRREFLEDLRQMEGGSRIAARRPAGASGKTSRSAAGETQAR